MNHMVQTLTVSDSHVDSQVVPPAVHASSPVTVAGVSTKLDAAMDATTVMITPTSENVVSNITSSSYISHYSDVKVNIVKV